MVNQDVPDPMEVSTEAFRIIELLSEYLVRFSVMEPIDIQLGDVHHVKGAKGDEDDEIE
jgi:hypothetical protein